MLFMAFLCVSQFSTRGVQKHHNTLSVGSPCQKLLAEVVEKTKTILDFAVVFSHGFFYSAFGRFSA
jgi:hypothetical protein